MNWTIVIRFWKSPLFNPAIILDMDLLAEHDAQIECKNKREKLSYTDGKKVVFQGHNQIKMFVTIIQAKRLLR